MSYIKKDFCDRLLDEVDIVKVVGSFIELRRAGSNLKGKSPWTDENTASFMVSPVKQIWHDFSSGKGGKAVTFLMEKEGMSYPESIEWLAKMYNREVEYESDEFAAKKEEAVQQKEALRRVLSAVHNLYRSELAKLDDSHPAWTEIKRRGYTREKASSLAIGFAPENFLYDKLKSSARVQEGEALGLISRQQQRSNYYDKYGGRLIYPIHDRNGLLIGFAGRYLGEDGKRGKWINPDVNDSNLLYRKDSTWYGMHLARTAIRKSDCAWVTEGYNDVIGWHNLGVLNTVAACGTAITKQQIKELKKICSKVILALDPDRAGRSSAIRNIPFFLEEGLTVQTAILPCDPDDYSREHYDEIKKAGLDFFKKDIGSFKKDLEKAGSPEALFSDSESFSLAVLEKGVLATVQQEDGFKLLLDEYVGNADTEVDKSKGAKRLCEIIASISDDTLVEIYIGWLQKESGLKLSALKRWISEYEIECMEVQEEQYVQIELPATVSCKLKDVEDDIRKYGLFMSDCKIWMSIDKSEDNKIRFTAVSNFMIEVLQHMADEKQAMKLFRIKNIHGLEKIFDSKSENLNSFQNFDNMVTDHGNYRFDGSRSHLQRLRAYLLDKMGVGRKIEQLGWQMDGRFWVWNNKITTETGADVPLDQHGIFIKDNVHYYVPSANEIYSNNPFKYEAQKKFKLIKNKKSFETLASKILQVHGEFGISAILFAIASLFQDICVSRTSKFPIFFLYGPGGTGKDELAEIIQSMVGHPQTAINLEANISTVKAQIREFAQFVNGISQLSEYKSGNPQIDGMLKSLWDRRGYKRGNIESMFSTDSVPIMSSVILTGNDYPKDQPLIIRLIWNEMTRNKFTEEEMKNFDELKDMVSDGLSGYSDDLIQYRNDFEKSFDKEQRAQKAFLKEQFPEAEGRVIFNLSILSATYHIFRNKITFPFTQAQMLDHFRTGVDQQIRKINSASILNKFWDLFIASLRGHRDDRIQVNHIVSMESNFLYIQWTHVFSKIQRSWWSQYQEGAPKKEIVMEQLVKSGAFVKSLARHSFDSGRDANRTSAVVVNLEALSETVRQDIQGSIMTQINQMDKEDDFSQKSPATPEKSKIISEDRPELPF